MSLGFAEKFSYREDVGTVGMSEIFDPPHVLDQKILQFAEMIQKNVDSLHLRSGIPREKLAELHSNSFREICPSCGAEYLRDFEVETIGMKKTSQHCSDVNCGGRLIDTVLDWEDALPPKEMNPAEKHCRMADVRNQVTPACNLPLKSLRNGANSERQESQFGDTCMYSLTREKICQMEPPGRKHTCSESSIAFHQISSSATYTSRLQRFRSQAGQSLKRLLHKQPFILKREMLRTRPIRIILKLNFSEGCEPVQSPNIEFPVSVQAPVDSIIHDKDAVTQKLRDAAIQSQCCRQFSLVERKNLLPLNETIDVYAITTNIIGYNNSFSTEDTAKNMVKRHNT